MSSILTNNSAMVALQTMKSISTNLAKTTADISTGKTVATAKDNAAVWAISKVMESDVQGFKGISDSLALGSSTIAVARQASETVTRPADRGEGQDRRRAGMQRRPGQDPDRHRSPCANRSHSVVGGAQFNGLNLVNGIADHRRRPGVAGSQRHHRDGLVDRR